MQGPNMEHQRVDSGFDNSYFSKRPSSTDAPPVRRSNTAPTRHRKPRRIPQDTNSNPQSPEPENHRPASEKRPRRSGEPCRKSVGSSSEHSTTRSRKQGTGSKPSSRRTSVTIVDPTRPTRQYRIKSSQTVPTTNRDVDDVLALHFRSCSLFHNPTYSTGQHLDHRGTNVSGYGTTDADTISSHRFEVSAPTSAPQPQSSLDAILPSESPKQSEDFIMDTVELPTTIMHWTSPTTRQREYEKIDRANSGIRGLLRRIVPRCVSGPPPPKFYEKDASDAGSVRRYRMDIDVDVSESKQHDKEDDVTVVEEEKKASSVRSQRRKLEKITAGSGAGIKKRWACF
ncbi:hypothetical protein BCR34DRAFT_19108 [Clohesyomyces aquaticus]|uniref:Uncharacterized protein n=1 Tax=Clohesyomyces aquaticus TaxID=1231657 RepID=A0A1Y1ZB68_9PLEO|nr:hypothetical protein BCR34DRAFT_19108 [Clohesyomyces aquaticus]